MSPRYPGSKGSTQGDTKDNAPKTRALRYPAGSMFLDPSC